MKTGEIAQFLNGELRGSPDVEILGVASLEHAGPADLAFAERKIDVRTTQINSCVTGVWCEDVRFVTLCTISICTAY